MGTSKATKDHHEALVAQADADADARVTARELEAFVVRYVRKQVASRFERLDRNRDGVVAKSEVPKMDGARFARFDADSDERLVASELESTLVPLALSRCRAAFARLDLDRDGAITLNEREPSDGRQASR